MAANDSFGWQPISMLRGQFDGNMSALRAASPAIADAVGAESYTDFFISTATGRIVLGRRFADGAIRPVENQITPQSAHNLARQVFPDGHCNQPIVIAGMDQGWLWQTVWKLPCKVPQLPNHRPPLYMLSRSAHRFGIALHLHDWRKLIGDGRNHLFIGDDAVAQLQAFMIAHPGIPWPRMALTVDGTLWTDEIPKLDVALKHAQDACNARLAQNLAALRSNYAGITHEHTIAKLRSGERLRVLGITSLYTTFLQYSMRDWLSAFEGLGHETKLAIETRDHHCQTNLTYSQAALDFQPDLILLIDHYRAELSGLPTEIPCAMWVQDLLPSIFSDAAGRAQGPLDYCIGMGKLVLAQRHGYPESRFLPAPVGTNENRFGPPSGTSLDKSKYSCDICYIGHASQDAGDIVREQLARVEQPIVRKLVAGVYERMQEVYDRNESLTHPREIEKLVDATAAEISLELPADLRRNLMELLTHQVNNALFRHQALSWAASLDVRLNIYGRGWDKHPRLKRFARGIADNQTQLATIYRASKINLQITPHGAVHQRLLDGLAAGGFFLLRYCPGDLADLHYKAIHDYCVLHHIDGDAALQQAAARETRLKYHLDRIAALSHVDPFKQEHPLVKVMQLAHESEWTRCAATVWEDYDQVTFESANQLSELVAHYLDDDEARFEIARRMRQQVLDRFTYRHLSQRLLKLIADDMATHAPTQRKAG